MLTELCVVSLRIQNIPFHCMFHKTLVGVPDTFFILFLTVADYTHDTNAEWIQEYSLVLLRWKDDSLATWPNSLPHIVRMRRSGPLSLSLTWETRRC